MACVLPLSDGQIYLHKICICGWSQFENLSYQLFFFFHFMVKSGICYREESRFTEAESLLKEWLPIAEKIKGKQSVLVGRISGLLGDVYRHMHMYNESQ